MKPLCNPAAILAAVLLGGVAAVPAAEMPAKPGTAAAKPAAPHMEIEQESIDLGQVVRGETAEAVFTIRNTGADVLKILNVRPG